MGTRTNTLFQGTISTAGFTTLYIVPAGVRTIVKNIVMSNYSGSTANFTIAYVHGTFQCGIASKQPFPTGTTAILPTYDVLQPGDEINTFAINEPYDLWISGSELLVT